MLKKEANHTEEEADNELYYLYLTSLESDNTRYDL